jgi:hypothetical protein
MRTKALFLTAVLGAAGLATSFAQTVYSQNVVGYINIPVQAGYNAIANQLNAQPNNNLSTILPSPPIGDTIFKWTAGAWESAVFAGDWLPDMALNPGDGAFYQAAAAGQLTFVGDVPQGTGLTVNLTPGFNLISSIVPQSASLDAMGYPANAGDTVYFLAAGGYISYINAGANTWLPPSDPPGLPDAPTPKVGESFWVDRGTSPAAQWKRDFTVQ